MTSRELTRRRLPGVAEIAGLAVVAYLPFLASARGRIASDSKQALYVDPGAFLADAAHLWDPGVAAGTVPHQHIGYLWPMGPWFWLFDLVGAPTWIAQRLWLGSLTFAAALGARWLARSLGLGRLAALAAALVYACTPYQLAFTARTSVLLLPWVGLPWLVELTRRAVDRGGWRHPALFALVAATVAGVNAPTLALVGVAPLLVLAGAALGGRRREAAGAGLRLAGLSLLTGLWWITALAVQSRHGLDVLGVTEDLRTTSSRSSPDDVLRGLGNWFFYGGDRQGPAVLQSRWYDRETGYVVASFLVPMAALAVAAVLRWRGRVLAVALLAATVLAVGPWPYDHPSPLGRLFRWAAESSAAGLAFRNSPRVVPVIALGLALVLAAGVAAVPERGRRGATALVALLAAASLAPVLREGMLSDPVERPAELPAAWHEAAAHLDRRGGETRVLQLPGANFAAHRWGNTIEPILPLLLDRPELSREVLPYGSPESALLLDALDRRLQNGVLDPASLAPVARLLGVGDVVVAGDLAHERFGLPGPVAVEATVVDPPAPGLGEPVTFGAPEPNAPGGDLDPLLPSDLRPGAPDRARPVAPVTVLAVADARGIVRVDPVGGAVVLDGDADGIVDAAAAEVLDGRGLVLAAAALDDAQLDRAVDGGARLVLTDSHRRRIQTWFSSIRDTRGPTERAGEVIVEPTGYDARLPSFPDATDDERTVVEQLGAVVTATSSGGAARPEDRPAAALDGRPSTSWRIGGADPTGEHLTVELESPRRIDALTFLQPQDGPRDRVVTRVRIRVGDADPVDVDLDDRSLAAPGQAVPLPGTTGERVDVEILATSTPPMAPELANAVGFAEVGIDGLTVAETVRLPVDLLRRVGDRSAAVALDVVLTRLRSSPDDWSRGDDEPVLDRSFDLPGGRAFAVTGVVRPARDATDEQLDDLYGTAGGTRVAGSSRLQGAPEARGSRALDGSPDTAWTSAFGATEPPTLDLRGTPSAATDELELLVAADGRHSVPRRVRVEADGEVVARADLGEPATEVDGGLATLRVPLDRPVRPGHLRLVVEDVVAVAATTPDPGGPALPVAVAEVRGSGFEALPATGTVDRACRDDLVHVDGDPVPVRITGERPDGSFAVAGCDPLETSAGRVRLRGVEGGALSLDEVLLRSPAPGGDAAATPDADVDAGARLTDVGGGRTTVDATVQSDGEPFWFSIGQSANDGWHLEVDGGHAGRRTVVDGYANGWLVTPDGAGEVRLTATWTPQRWVWLGLGASLAGVLACLAIVVATSRRRGPATPVGVAAAPTPTTGDGDPDAGTLVPLDRSVRPLGRTEAATAAAVGVGVALASRWWIGVLAAAVALVVGRWPAASWAVAVAAPTVLGVARFGHRPELGWAALALVVAAVAADVVSSRGRRRGPPR